VILPQDEQLLLRKLSPDLPALRARVRALRARGWTLESIGTPLGARRSTVRSWEFHSHAVPDPHLPPPPSPPPPTSAHPPPPYPPTIPAPTATQAERIRALAPKARRARAGTPPSSSLAQARDELNELVTTLYNQGVPISHLAHLAGVTYRAMSVRIRTHAANQAEEHPPT